MNQKVKGPAIAATMNMPGIQVDKQLSGTSDEVAWRAPPLAEADFERRIHDLEVVADWRDELTARITREALIFEFADCITGEDFDALEAEVALFNQVCLAIAAPTPEGDAA